MYSVLRLLQLIVWLYSAVRQPSSASFWSQRVEVNTSWSVADLTMILYRTGRHPWCNTLFWTLQHFWLCSKISCECFPWPSLIWHHSTTLECFEFYSVRLTSRGLEKCCLTNLELLGGFCGLSLLHNIIHAHIITISEPMFLPQHLVLISTSPPACSGLRQEILQHVFQFLKFCRN